MRFSAGKTFFVIYGIFYECLGIIQNNVCLGFLAQSRYSTQQDFCFVVRKYQVNDKFYFCDTGTRCIYSVNVLKTIFPVDYFTEMCKDIAKYVVYTHWRPHDYIQQTAGGKISCLDYRLQICTLHENLLNKNEYVSNSVSIVLTY